jgi:predicted nuclease of predicted toxin-antitoxin system
MRITVSTILKMLASGKSVQDVLEAYPELQLEDVQQAMKYAAWVVSDQIHAVKA